MVVLYSQYDLHATLYALRELTIDLIQDVKFHRVLTCERYPDLIAFLRRRLGQESFLLLRSVGAEWQVEHVRCCTSFRCL